MCKERLNGRVTQIECHPCTDCCCFACTDWCSMRVSATLNWMKRNFSIYREAYKFQLKCLYIFDECADKASFATRSWESTDRRAALSLSLSQSRMCMHLIASNLIKWSTCQGLFYDFPLNECILYWIRLLNTLCK